MMKILQINLNRAHTAHDLLEQTLEADGYQLAVISEQNPNRTTGTGLEVDTKGDAAIWVSKGKRGSIRRRERGSGFVWIDVETAIIYSCYISPNCTMEEFEAYMEELEESVACWSPRTLVVLAGDFNSSAEEWGRARSGSRGDALRKMTSRGGFQLANDGKAAIYRRAGTESFLDLTWFSEGAVGRVST